MNCTFQMTKEKHATREEKVSVESSLDSQEVLSTSSSNLNYAKVKFSESSVKTSELSYEELNQSILEQNCDISSEENKKKEYGVSETSDSITKDAIHTQDYVNSVRNGDDKNKVVNSSLQASTSQSSSTVSTDISAIQFNKKAILDTRIKSLIVKSGTNYETPSVFTPEPKLIPSSEDPSILIDTGLESEAHLSKHNPVLYKYLTKPLDKISHHIQLLSYNLFLRPPPTRTNYNKGNGDFKDQRLTYLLDPEKNPKIVTFDIICLQEVFGFLNKRKDYCIRKASQLGFKYFTTIAGSWLSLKPIDSGLLILSKYPIIESDQQIFSRGTHIDGWTSKGALFARILLPNNTHILVFNAHLQADYTGKDPLYWNIQRSQIKELRDFIDKKVAIYPQDQVVIMADMNVDSKHHRGNRDDELPNNEHSDIYLEMIEILNDNSSNIEYHDILFEQNQQHPITYGYAEMDPNTGKYVPFETVLTNSASVSVRHSIDYIFFGRKENQEQSLTVTPESARVEQFFVKDEAFTQLSDHYAVTAQIDIHRNENSSVIVSEE